MKKNISINISGIIFYIEEDGYDKLKQYLDSINQYFSKFDESSEIVADIESRIAEIFLSKLKDGKQVITLEDVDSLIATMGSIKDFKAVEEPQLEFEEEQEYREYKADKTKKLYRDVQRKILGGVASGMGHYFSIDPLWIRLFFLLFFFAFFFEPEIAFVVPLIYIILWIIIPGSDELTTEKKYKKMFRNPDDKVLGGVAGGIAAYFGVDVVLIRVLFVILIFIGFSGPIIYIILWIILPEAKSITDKMEMQGEPVTLTNIEQNIKKSFNVKEGEENTFIKILLFPFRLIALLINAISKGLGPFMRFLVEAVRVIAGIIIIITGVSTLFGLVIGLGALIGIFAGGDWYIADFFPIEVIQNSIPVSGSIALFFVLFIPFLFLTILGVMVISKQNLIKPAFGWSMFSLWVVALIILAVTIPTIVRDFSREGSIEMVENYDINGTAVLKLADTGYSEYDMTSLRLRGYEDSTFQLVKKFISRGSSRLKASEYANMIVYNVSVKDSIFIFDPSLSFKEDAIFRAQQANMTLYVPYRHKFRMERELSEILRNTLYMQGYSVYQMQNNEWMFTEEGLLCITCENEEEEIDTLNSRQDIIAEGQTVNYSNFDYLDIGNTFIAYVTRHPTYDIKVETKDQRIEHIEFEQNADQLKIRYRETRSFLNSDREKIILHIKMPDLEGIDLHGGTQTYVSGFQTDNFQIALSGTAFAEVNLVTEDIDIDMSGASKLILKGNGKYMNLNASGIANINAFDFIVDEANVDAVAAVTANLFVNDYLNVDAAGGCTIKYKGDPRINKDELIGSNIQKVN